MARRAELRGLLHTTSTAEALGVLKISESDLLKRWREDLLSAPTKS